jgi:L,D-transpeptidase ErfK/SrfK
MNRMTLSCVLLAACASSACAPAVKRAALDATESTSKLPPHAVEVGYGMWSCESGYVMRQKRCVSEEEAAKEPWFEIFGAPEEPTDLEAPRPRPNFRTAMPNFVWRESDFAVRAVTAYSFSLDPKNPNTVIGEATSYAIPRGETVYEAARHLDLGVNQIAAAFPELDLLDPPRDTTLDFPTMWILPDSDYQGLVINIPELRIYYFPRGRPGTVYTFPVGLGRDDWRTPIDRFKVVEKTVNPAWLIPETIRAEHIRERNDARTMIAGGDPENPLGHYRLRLNLPLYGIHGTNIPWGIGMQVTHGCIRLYPEDIERLYEMVPVGTPGQFVYEPVKVGARDGEIYVEVHPDFYGTQVDYVAEAERLLRAKGWSGLVDPELLTNAVEKKHGAPTRISRAPATIPIEASLVAPTHAKAPEQRERFHRSGG